MMDQRWALPNHVGPADGDTTHLHSCNVALHSTRSPIFNLI